MLMIAYAFVGLLYLIISTDIPRYLPLIWILGVGSVILTVVALIILFTQVPLDQRTGIFWIVFVDFAEGLAQGILMVALLIARPRKIRGCHRIGSPLNLLRDSNGLQHFAMAEPADDAGAQATSSIAAGAGRLRCQARYR